MKAFKQAPVHDLGPDSVADIRAHTITYGLLSARVADPKSKASNAWSLAPQNGPLPPEVNTEARGRTSGPEVYSKKHRSTEQHRSRTPEAA
jgi:hypothetical protein